MYDLLSKTYVLTRCSLRASVVLKLPSVGTGMCRRRVVVVVVIVVFTIAAADNY